MDGHGHILVVDDHRPSRLKISFAVQKLGHSVEMAADGIEALERLHARAFDLVLLDIVMPRMDGFELLATLKQSPRLHHIPIVVISSESETENIVRGIELGAEDFLPKDFDPVILEARVSTCLEKKRFRDQEIEYLRQVARLTDAASALENDSFDSTMLSDMVARDDSLGALTRLFQRMAEEFQTRERRLKQEVMALQIQVDKAKQTQQVDTITGTRYFQQLRSRANNLREMLELRDD